MYVVRTNDEVTNKYRDVIYDFVDDPGVFIGVSRDRIFTQIFRQAIMHNLEVEKEYINLVPDTARATDLIQYFYGPEERVVHFFLNTPLAPG